MKKDRFLRHFLRHLIDMMSETSPNPASLSSAEATPLAALVGAPTVAHCGSLTPERFDAPATEMAALATGIAVHDLGWLRRLTLTGEDRTRWLNGMVTNNIKDLPEGASNWNLVLNAQGHILGTLTASLIAGRLELTTPADQLERILTHFDRLIIMDDVEIERCDGLSALGVSGPKAAEALTALGIAAPSTMHAVLESHWQGHRLIVERDYEALLPHFQIWIEATAIGALWQALLDAQAKPVGIVSLEALRIAEAIPAYGTDLAERDLPQESSQMRALNFSKGCYLGQEIIERVRSRGMVRRHLRALLLDGPVPAPGTALTLEDGTAAGEVTSAAQLELPSGTRTVALGRIPAPVELRSQALHYTHAAQAGLARLLDAPQPL